MRVLVQRVSEAMVEVVDEDGGVEPVGAIGPGLCALVGVTHTDDERAARSLADKVWHLRVFPDEEGRMDLPVAAVGGAVLVVSQFTLYGDTRRGRRPSWGDAAAPEVAAPLVDAFAAALADLGATVSTGRFGDRMRVALVNEGPVTLLLET